MKYVVTRRGARQIDEEGLYLQLGDRKFRPGDEVPCELVDEARNKGLLLEQESLAAQFDDAEQQAAHDQDLRRRRQERRRVEEGES